ncbi:MAG: ATP-binding cassette domain-containing protein [Verrucomicrobia bacterium]|nr:ATP-binding cassette domain-containing protein [Verrucomicrobiota bacterium]
MNKKDEEAVLMNTPSNRTFLPFSLHLVDLRISIQGVAIVAASDISIPTKAKTVLLGNSGSGKSTLLKALLGLLAAGTVVEGHVIDRITQRHYSGVELKNGKLPAIIRCGYLPQSGSLLPHHTTAGGFLKDLMRHTHTTVMNDWLEFFGLERNEYFDSKLPTQFSGGERRRFALAVVLSSNPELIFLDEPTSGLDDERVEELLLRLTQLEHTMIFATHDYVFASRLADQVIFLENGKVAEQARSDEFFRRPRSEGAKRYCDAWRRLLREHGEK